MTAEEIEIIVTAKIESALKEFQKLVPAIKQAMRQTQEAMSKINTDTMSSKVSKAVQLIKNKIQDLKKSSKNNEISIKVNNKDAQKQISQIQKQIDSLQEKINARQMKLNIINPQIDKIVEDTRNSVVPDGISKNDKSMDTTVNNTLSSNKDFTSLNSQAQKLYTEIEMYNNQLSVAKSKMAELGQQTSQTVTTQSKLGSFFNVFKSKIEQTKSSSKGLQSTLSKLPKITQNVTNNIKGMGSGLKQGLGHVLKYATALFSIRGIYSILSQSAQSWLSSQNSEAQQLSANIEYMKYAMGSVFAPVIEYVTNLVYQLMKAIQSVVYAFSRINIFAKATASSMNKTAGSASKASKSLSGVHNEINNVSENNNSGGSGTTSPSMDLSQMDNTPNSIVDAIKNGNWYEVGATVGEKLNEAMENIPWEKIQNIAKNIGTGIAKTINGFIATTDWNQVGNTFAQGINTIIYTGYEFITTFDWKQFGQAISNSINGFLQNIDWSTAGQTVSEGIKGIFDSISGFLETFDWSAIVNGLFEFVATFDWNSVSDSIFRALGSACASLVNLGMVIGEKINEAMDNAKQYFQGKIEECGGNVVLGILKGIGDAILGIGQWIYEHIFQPFIDGFKDAFGIHSPSTVMQEMGQYIVQGLFNGLSNIWETAQSIFTNLVSKIGEKFTEIKTNIGNWAENTKETIKAWTENVKTKISECWANVSSTLKEKIETVKSNISTGLSNAKSTITTWASNVKTSWREHWNTMANNVKSGLETVKSNINSWGNNIGSTFANLGSSATTWGKDLVSNMASGIKNNIDKVSGAVNSIASKIKNLLGFSEPEEGPLSNFHTYMPDMIDLMAKGIRSNMGKVTEELEKLTATMAYTINTPDIEPLKLITTSSDYDTTKPSNIMAETFKDEMSNFFASNNGNGRPINLNVYVGNTKLGQILLEDLRNMKRQTGQNIEALVGG